jgi:hypothetical protein
VSEAFVDEFLALYNLSSKPSDFVVDLGTAAKWLSTRKGNLKKTLVKSYVRDMDYVLERPPRGSTRGRGHSRTELIRLTSDCFKTLCMQARTVKAAEVRAYFLAVEAALFRYRQEIADALAHRVAQLENNQRPAPSIPQGTGVIYVVRASAHRDSVFKIGRTTNLTQRLRSHGSAQADALEVMYVFKTRCIEKVEACMKLMLREHQYRKYKEVYEINLPALKRVISSCDDACMETVYQRPRHLSSRMTGGYYAVVSRDAPKPPLRSSPKSSMMG